MKKSQIPPQTFGIQSVLVYHRQTNVFRPVYFSTDFHDAVFVVGALDETLLLRGMRYHPTDIENSVMRAHKRIAER